MTVATPVPLVIYTTLTDAIGATNDWPRPCVRARGARSARNVAQAGRQLAPQRAPALDVERLVDRLVADAHRLVPRKVEPQALGNLLRAPRPRPAPGLPRPMSTAFPGHGRSSHRRPARGSHGAGEPILHIRPQRRVGDQFRPLRPTRRPLRVPVRRDGPIRQLATPRGRVAPVRRSASDRARSRTPPAPAGAQPPARPSPAPATARSPPAQQTKDSVAKAAWPSATGATAPSRPPLGTSGTQPAAIPRPPSPRPRSTILPQQTPRAAAGAPAAPREGAPATSACPAKPDPNADDPPSQQSS